MSAHVRDRLSAYLDQELVPAERTAVETHLHGCDACRQHLETLAAVDAAARAFPAEAPAGYFDAFPGRVRARLEEPAPRVRRVPLRLPAWTWAAAAVLVLGVVTPLTMVSVWRSREEPIPAPRPAELPPPAEAARPEAAGGEKEEMKASTAGELKLRRAAPGSGTGTTPVPAGGSIPATGPARDAFAPAPPAAPAENSSVAPALAAAPPPAPGLNVRKRAPAPGGPYEQPQTQAQSVGHPSTGPVTSASRADEPAASEAEYERLLVAPAQTAASLRARREAWRAYALRFPQSRHADEARVRVVETGAAAWRLGHDPNDRARVREDAAAYIGGKDAAQAPRVRAILEDLGGS